MRAREDQEEVVLRSAGGGGVVVPLGEGKRENIRNYVKTCNGTHRKGYYLCKGVNHEREIVKECVIDEWRDKDARLLYGQTE